MSYTNLKYHIVFSTKQRRPLIGAELRPRLVKYIGGIIRQLKGRLLEADGTEDHLHLAAGIHPQTPLADLVRDVKANSSGWIHRTFPDLSGFAWQEGYSAFTVSHSVLPQVTEYICQQAEHHRRMTFKRN
jgi:putative transposase